MKKNLLIILLGIFILVVTLIIILFAALLSPKPSPLSVISTSPEDQSSNILPDSDIIITFNKEPKTNDIRFSSIPEISGSVEIVENNYIFKPTSPLSNSTNYIITLGLLDRKPTGVHGFTFQTGGGPTPSPLPDTRPEELIEQSGQFQKQKYPDVYLSNQTPYSNDNFSIVSEYTLSPAGHFYFTVILKGDKTKSKENFIDWLRSLGLTNSQISALDIRYE